MYGTKFAILIILAAHLCSGQQVRVATANIWTGLTYEGTLTIGSYEDDGGRAARHQALVRGIRHADPDVIALQEVNPAGSLAAQIASGLGYEVISQRVLSGVKFGPIGIPWNLNEGLAILARPGFGLEFVDVIPLSPDFGAFGDVLSFHAGEQNAALIASVRLDAEKRIIIVNVHLPSSPEDTRSNRVLLKEICRQRSMNVQETAVWLEKLADADTNRRAMISGLVRTIEERFPHAPLILLGDFNMPLTGAEQAGLNTNHGFTPATIGSVSLMPTWDGRDNPLTLFSSGEGSHSRPEDPIAALSRMSDAKQRSLDHIFLRTPIGAERIRKTERILDKPVDGSYASDHYGIMTTLDLNGLREEAPGDVSTVDVLPIASYDNDVGFGYGVKGFFLSQMDHDESFDIIAFNSTKGERWYRLVFSMPDFELRQGTPYPLAVDVVIDYDRYLKNAFFGIGQRAPFTDKEEYTKELFESQILFSRGLSRRSVVQAGGRYRWIRNSNFGDSSTIPLLPAGQSTGTATAISLQASFRHDSRNSYINPSRGIVLQADAEYAPPAGNVTFYQAGAAFQYYATLMYPRTVFAFRIAGQTIDGPDIPLQFLLPLGGNKTIRGYPENRFLGRTMFLTTAELRFPLIWRFGAILAMDAGNIWMTPSDVSFSGWKTGPAVGLRFFMDTFVVRADLGFSAETSGFYLNFGHIF